MAVTTKYEQTYCNETAKEQVTPLGSRPVPPMSTRKSSPRQKMNALELYAMPRQGINLDAKSERTSEIFRLCVHTNKVLLYPLGGLWVSFFPEDNATRYGRKVQLLGP